MSTIVLYTYCISDLESFASSEDPIMQQSKECRILRARGALKIRNAVCAPWCAFLCTIKNADSMEGCSL